MSGKAATVEKDLYWPSDIYKVYRKDTPEVLISKIIDYLKKKYKGSLDIAVDVGCGTGQGTIVLSPIFQKVYGIDGLESQIKEAKSNRSCSNVEYQIGRAEALPFENNSVQLITTSTALHWFDMNLFFAEARRILSNNGVLAVYGYTRIKPYLSNSLLNQQSDELFDWLFQVLDPYLKPEVRIIFNKYKSVDFPFEDVVRVPDARCFIKGRLSDIIGFLKTIMVFKICREQDPAKGKEIMTEFKKRLYEIGAADNISPDEVTTLYIDYTLIFCRKETR